MSKALSISSQSIPIAHFRYIRILTWLRGFMNWVHCLVFPEEKSTKKTKTKYRNMSRNSRSHVLIYRTWAISWLNKWVEAWEECGLLPIRNINLSSGHRGIIDKVILLICLQQNLDTEWKFTRTKLWLNWIYKKGVLPPPFNILYVLLPVRWIIKRLLAMCIPAAILVSNEFLNSRIG